MKNTFFLIAPLFCFISMCVCGQGTAQLQGYQSAKFSGNKLLVKASNGYIEIVPYGESIIRVTYKKHRNDTERSHIVVARPANVKVVYSNGKSFIELRTKLIKVVVNKADLTVSFLDKHNDTLSGAFNYLSKGDGSQIDFKSDGKEAFYGGGFKAIALDKRGQVLQNYNQAHYGYKYGETDLNISIPLLLSNRKYGLYIDNPAKSSFDVCKTDAKVVGFKTTSGMTSFFFIGGESIDSVLYNYTYLTGRQPLPPRWALGYISSRYGYKSERELNDVVNKTQAAGIPLDAMVMDLYWYKSSTLMGNHSWYRDSFPDPHKMLASLLRRGIRLIPISETYITDKSENWAFANNNHLLTADIKSYPEAHIFKNFWAGAPSGLLDIFKPKAQKFYWGLYKQRIKEGVAGWWFDLAEPELTTDSLVYAWGSENKVHNLYALTWAKTAFDGYRRDFPKSRVFTLIRSGTAGMQRYSTFPWSGDNSRSFEGLRAQIPVILNMGLSGIGYMHSDAGGFTGSTKQDTELYSRWLEFAAFSPVMRTHAAKLPPEPIFWDDATRKRVTKYIKLRYQLLPYNYTMAYENTMTGRPLMKPINYYEANNKRLGNINDEYLWGDKLLVAPVIAKGQTRKKVLFPEGEWIGFNNLKVYRDSAEVDAPVDSLPLFVKAGSIIPMVNPITSTAQYKGKTLMLKYYSGNDAGAVKSDWFYDDGADPMSLKKKKYELVSFTTRSSANKYNLIIKPEHSSGKPVQFQLVMMGRQIKSVRFSRKTKYKILTAGMDKATVNFTWNGKPVELDIKAY